MKKFLVFLVLLFAFSLGKTRAVFASGRLYLDPASGSYSIGDQFDVSVMADPGTSQIVAIDGLINYDNTRLDVVKVEEAIFFKNDAGSYQGFSYSSDADTGRISIYSFATIGNFSVTTAGKIATVTFKATAQGEAAASFVCQAGSSEDSSMWDIASEDSIDCGSNGSGTYTIGAATGPTNTPTPTPTIASTAPDSPTATPSELPQSGIEMPLLIVLLGGALLLGAGLLVGVI
jgi:hypothetical protein